MPVTTPQQKIDKTRMFGGPFITNRLVGDIFDQCYRAAQEHVAASGAVMVPPFDHDDIIEGQASVAAEILEQLPEGETIDRLVMPVGGAAFGRPHRLSRRPCSARGLPFAEPTGAPSLKRSLEGDAIVTLPRVDNFVDGAAVARIGTINSIGCGLSGQPGHAAAGKTPSAP